MRIIESPNHDRFFESIRTEIVQIVKHFYACQLKQGKLRRLLFSIRDLVVGELDHVLQLYVMKLRRCNVLYDLDIGTGIQNGTFISKIYEEIAWRTL